MGALLNLWGRKRPPAPPVEGALPVLDPATLLQPHRPQLAAIRQLVGVRALTAKRFTPRSSRPIQASCNTS